MVNGQIKVKKKQKRQCQRRQPKGKKFEAPAPLICLVLSATDKMGQIGEEEEKSDEKKKNKKHLISPASFRDQSTEEKLHQLVRTLQSPRWMWGV